MHSPSSKGPVVRVVEAPWAGPYKKLHLTLFDGVRNFGDCIATSWEWIEPGWWYLNNIQVDPDFQGHGFGSLLIYRLCEELKKKGIVGLYVAPAATEADLERLERFYIKNGFEKHEWGHPGQLPWQKRLTQNHS
jgi:GNAT superfamily N-acetyltransferase